MSRSKSLRAVEGILNLSKVILQALAGLILILTGTAGYSGAVTSGNEFDQDGSPLVALTFDDGPHATLTPRLLDILAKEDTPATFYVVGKMVSESPEVAQRIVDEGHEIGNHSWTHPDLRKLSDEKINKELANTAKAIEKHTGSQPYSTRPPYGGLNARVAKAIPREYQPVVLWTVDPKDWQKPGIQKIVERVVGEAKPGSILLLHDIHEESVEAVPKIIGELRNKGFKFVTVSQILTTKHTVDLE